MKNTKILAVMLCGSLLLSGCNTHNISEPPDIDSSCTTPMPVFSTTDESVFSTTAVETTLPLSADTSADTTTTTSQPQSETPIEETAVSSETTEYVTVHWPLDEEEDTILNNNIYTSATESTSVNEVFCPPATYVSTTERTQAATTTTIETKKPEETTTKPETTANSTIIDIPDESLEFIDDYTHKYYYNTLTDTQKAYYRYCFNKKRYLINKPEPNYSSKDKDIAYYAFQRENPHLQLYPTQYQINNELTSMTPQKREKILKIANTIADKAKKYDRTFDKLKVIHDELLDLITYESYKEMVSVFLEGKADCSGYADAFCMVCQLAGIDCIVVYGTGKNGGVIGEHAWNMVKIGNVWYNVDLCWDDVKRFRYKYFLNSDTSFSRNHTINMPISYPKAPKNYPVDRYGNETE